MYSQLRGQRHEEGIIFQCSTDANAAALGSDTAIRRELSLGDGKRFLLAWRGGDNRKSHGFVTLHLRISAS